MHQYFLLVALKDLISIFVSLNTSFDEYIDSVLPGLIVHFKSEEESVRSMVSECMGALLIMCGDKIIETILPILNNTEDKFSRRTISTSVRHYLSRYAQKTKTEDVQNLLTESRMNSLLALLSDSDLDVRKSALLMLNAAVHHQPELVRTQLRDSIVPILLEIMRFKLVREVDLGPFKHRIDDGLPLRKAALIGTK